MAATVIDDYSHQLALLRSGGHEPLPPACSTGRLRTAAFTVLIPGDVASVAAGEDYDLIGIPVDSGLAGLFVVTPTITGGAQTALLDFGYRDPSGGDSTLVHSWQLDDDGVYRLRSNASVPALTDSKDALGTIDLASAAQLITIYPLGGVVFKSAFNLTMSTRSAAIDAQVSVQGFAVYVVD